MTTPQLYKVLDTGGKPYHGGTGKWTKGRWRTVAGELVPCKNGLHACTIGQLPRWLGPEVWLFETDGEVIDAGDKMVARKGRITERLDTWNETTARLFAADCAEHVLPLFEQDYPADDRPRRAIEAARAFARGEIDEAALAGAEYATRYATRYAAGSAGYAAGSARYAAGSAAGSAAEAEWQSQRLAAYLTGELR